MIIMKKIVLILSIFFSALILADEFKQIPIPVTGNTQLQKTNVIPGSAEKYLAQINMLTYKDFVLALRTCAPGEFETNTVTGFQISFTIIGTKREYCEVIFNTPRIKSTCFLTPMDVAMFASDEALFMANAAEQGEKINLPIYQIKGKCQDEKVSTNVEELKELTEFSHGISNTMINEIPNFGSLEVIPKEMCKKITSEIDEMKRERILRSSVERVLKKGRAINDKKTGWNCGGDPLIILFTDDGFVDEYISVLSQ